ncbi:MAG: antitoxin MazE family protein [Micrococcales bacterium]|nr:antitoxin MazE family protein [Micrococcales bacterium]
MTVRDRVEAHRERMRAQGLRLVQMWVPDVRSKRFAAEAARQSTAVGVADRHSDDQEFVEAIAAEWDE